MNENIGNGLPCADMVRERNKNRQVNLLWFFSYWFWASVCEMVMAATIKAAAIRLGGIKTRC